MKYLIKIKRSVSPLIKGPYDREFVEDYFRKKCRIENFTKYVNNIHCSAESVYCEEHCPFNNSRDNAYPTIFCLCSLSSSADKPAVSRPTDTGLNNSYEKYVPFIEALNELRAGCVKNAFCIDDECSLSNGFKLCLCGGLYFK